MPNAHIAPGWVTLHWRSGTELAPSLTRSDLEVGKEGHVPKRLMWVTAIKETEKQSTGVAGRVHEQAWHLVPKAMVTMHKARHSWLVHRLQESLSADAHWALMLGKWSRQLLSTCGQVLYSRPARDQTPVLGLEHKASLGLCYPHPAPQRLAHLNQVTPCKEKEQT